MVVGLEEQTWAPALEALAALAGAAAAAAASVGALPPVGAASAGSRRSQSRVSLDRVPPPAALDVPDLRWLLGREVGLEVSGGPWTIQLQCPFGERQLIWLASTSLRGSGSVGGDRASGRLVLQLLDSKVEGQVAAAVRGQIPVPLGPLVICPQAAIEVSLERARGTSAVEVSVQGSVPSIHVGISTRRLLGLAAVGKQTEKLAKAAIDSFSALPVVPDGRPVGGGELPSGGLPKTRASPRQSRGSDAPGIFAAPARPDSPVWGLPQPLAAGSAAELGTHWSVQMSCEVTAFSLAVQDDSEGAIVVPLLRLEVPRLVLEGGGDLDVSLPLLWGRLEGRLGLEDLSCCLFHHRKESYEPLLDPWSLNARFVADVDPQGPQSKLQISAPERLELTLSTDSVLGIAALANLAGGAVGPVGLADLVPVPLATDAVEASLLLRNDSGCSSVACYVYGDGQGKIGTAGGLGKPLEVIELLMGRPAAILRPKEGRYLYPRPPSDLWVQDEGPQEDDTGPSHRQHTPHPAGCHVFIQPGAEGPMHGPIPLARPGIWNFKLASRTSEGHWTPHLVCQLSHRSLGGSELLLRSNCLLESYLPEELVLEAPSHHGHWAERAAVPLPAWQEGSALPSRAWVPLASVEDGSLDLIGRAGARTSLQLGSLVWELEHNESSGSIRVLRLGRSTALAWARMLPSSGADASAGDLVISLLPPIVLRNGLPVPLSIRLLAGSLVADAGPLEPLAARGTTAVDATALQALELQLPGFRVSRRLLDLGRASLDIPMEPLVATPAARPFTCRVNLHWVHHAGPGSIPLLVLTACCDAAVSDGTGLDLDLCCGAEPLSDPRADLEEAVILAANAPPAGFRANGSLPIRRAVSRRSLVPKSSSSSRLSAAAAEQHLGPLMLDLPKGRAALVVRASGPGPSVAVPVSPAGSGAAQRAMIPGPLGPVLVSVSSGPASCKRPAVPFPAGTASELPPVELWSIQITPVLLLRNASALSLAIRTGLNSAARAMELPLRAGSILVPPLPASSGHALVMQLGLLTDASGTVAWSSSIDPERLPRQCHLQLPGGGAAANGPPLLRLTQEEVGLCRVLTVAQAGNSRSDPAPFRVDNVTPHALLVAQVAGPKASFAAAQSALLPPNGSTGLAWWDPIAARRLLRLQLVAADGSHWTRDLGELDLEDPRLLGSLVEVRRPPRLLASRVDRLPRLAIHIHAEGPTRVVKLLDLDRHPGLLRTLRHAATGALADLSREALSRLGRYASDVSSRLRSSASLAALIPPRLLPGLEGQTSHQPPEPKSRAPLLAATIGLGGLGISLVEGSSGQDLLYLALSDLGAAVSIERRKGTSAMVGLGSIQLDLAVGTGGSTSPALVTPYRHPFFGGESDRSRVSPAVGGTGLLAGPKAVKVLLRVPSQAYWRCGLLQVEELDLQLAPLGVTIALEHLSRLGDSVVTAAEVFVAAWRPGPAPRSGADGRPLPAIVAGTRAARAPSIAIGRLALGRIDLSLGISMASGQTDADGAQVIPPKLRAYLGDTGLLLLDLLLHIEDARASLSPLVIGHRPPARHRQGRMVEPHQQSPPSSSLAPWTAVTPAVCLEDLAARLGAHYRYCALTQVARIAGSLELFGDPSTVLAHVSEGLRPFLALAFQSSGGQGHGLVLRLQRAFRDLGRHLLLAGFQWAVKTARTLRRAVRLLEARGYSMHEVVAAIAKRTGTSGTPTLLSVLIGAVHAALEAPLRGAEQGGVAGFTRGLVTGCCGLVVLPLAFLLEEIVQMAASIRDSVAGLGMGLRTPPVRPPRPLLPSPESPLSPYLGHLAAARHALVDGGLGSRVRVSMPGRHRDGPQGPWAPAALALTDTCVLCCELSGRLKWYLPLSGLRFAGLETRPEALDALVGPGSGQEEAAYLLLVAVESPAAGDSLAASGALVGQVGSCGTHAPATCPTCEPSLPSQNGDGSALATRVDEESAPLLARLAPAHMTGSRQPLSTRGLLLSSARAAQRLVQQHLLPVCGPRLVLVEGFLQAGNPAA